jgi:hypothetical protein
MTAETIDMLCAAGWAVILGALWGWAQLGEPEVTDRSRETIVNICHSCEDCDYCTPTCTFEDPCEDLETWVEMYEEN